MHSIPGLFGLGALNCLREVHIRATSPTSHTFFFFFFYNLKEPGILSAVLSESAQFCLPGRLLRAGCHGRVFFPVELNFEGVFSFSEFL